MTFIDRIQPFINTLFNIYGPQCKFTTKHFNLFNGYAKYT